MLPYPTATSAAPQGCATRGGMGAPHFYPPTHLVFAIILLGVPQHTVAQPKHVLVGSVLLVRQLLQPHQGPFTTLVLEGGFQDPKDLPPKQGCKCCVTLHTASHAWLGISCAWCTARPQPCPGARSWPLTCFRMFCSRMSFCRSRLGLVTTMSSTFWPLLGTSLTKNTKSSSSWITNLQGARCQRGGGTLLPGRPLTHRTQPTRAQVPAMLLAHFVAPKSPRSGLKTLPGKLLADPPYC